MLAEMRIQGLGVIDDATLELDPGLTVLTGETGAGKTMVVTGLTLLGGGRAEASRVADGARRAVVEGRFSAEPAAVAVADEVGAEPDDDGTLIAVRTVGADGRSRAHLGGRSVPVGVLGRLGGGHAGRARAERPAPAVAARRAAGPVGPFRGRDGGRAVGAATGRCGPSGCGSPPSSSSVATVPASSPRKPTCCATGSPRSPPSTRSRGRTSNSSPTPVGSRRPTSCVRSRRRRRPPSSARRTCPTCPPRWR